MEFTTRGLPTTSLIVSLISLGSTPAGADTVGLSTRDQNPILQAYYLPAIGFGSKPDWQYSHSLHITNTYQTESTGAESLVIDAESYRYDFALAYQHNDWRLAAKIPFIAISGGTLDGMIEDWHDFFGLPAGGRDLNPNDQLNIEYIQNGQTRYLQTRPENDVGDIELSLSYRIGGDEKQGTELMLGIELPTGSVEANTGNEATDIALGVSHRRAATDLTSLYCLLAYSRLGKGGQLSDRLKSGIWVAQLGAQHAFSENVFGILQFDMHSALVKNTALTSLGNSLQMQLGLQFRNLIENHSLDLFFSEDIAPDSAPDITFSVRLSSNY